MKRILVMLCAVAVCFSVNAQYSLTFSDFQTFQITENNEIFITTHFERALDSLAAVDSAEPNPHDFFRVTVVNGTVYLEEDIQLVVDSINAILGTSGSGAESFTCGTSTVTYDGHNYSTVAIGGQCWFAENLRTTKYADGTSIQEVTDGTAWSELIEGARCAYNDDASNLEAYGRLYNWYAVEDSRGLCPTGWHVPTNDEWSALTTHLGGESVAGDKMKSSATNSPSWDGSNSSGFSGLPGGRRSWYDGSFGDEGNSGIWWSTSPYGTVNIFIRRLSSGLDGAIRENNGFRSGFSVRCVRDAE